MLTTLPFNNEFDLASGVGQRKFTFTFARINGVTGEHLGFITPIRNAILSHDTTRLIKRQLTLNLGAADSAIINTISDRIDVTMIAGDGSSWPLGRYMFTDNTEKIFTSGTLDNVVLNDEMFKVDQVIVSGIDGDGPAITDVTKTILSDIGIPFSIEASPFFASQSWAAGSTRGNILETLATAGDYFSPWFGNDKMFRMIRSFDPITKVPQFDWDSGSQVIRDPITRTSNLLTAPNRFLVISNTNASTNPVTGVAYVPANAPHSFSNRGFYITDQRTLQLTDSSQALAVAQNLANRFTIFNTETLTTGIDPRHDSYDVIRWQGSLWLELSWSMNFTTGVMNHTLRKAYTS